jgi:hypothetical protein
LSADAAWQTALKPIIACMIPMNGLEFFIFIAAAALLAGYGRVEFKSTGKALLLAAAVLPAAFLALESATQFMTIDAAGRLFPETVFVEHSDLRQFESGAFRTSEMLLVPLAGTLRHLVSDIHRLAMWLKGFHWMAGFLCLLAIHRVSRFFIENHTDVFFVVFFYIGLLLPTNSLALKVYNYDKLSLFLAVLGVLLMARAIKEPSGRTATLGLISLAFAAQEKLIAAPFLWLALPVFVYLRVNTDRRYDLWRECFISTLVAVAAVLVVHLLPVAVIGLASGYRLPVRTALKPLLSVVWPLKQPALGVPEVAHSVGLLLICVVFTFSGSLLLHALAKRLRGKKRLLSPPSTGLAALTRAAVPAVFIIGVIWTYLGEILLGPAAAVPDHLHQPARTFNDLFWHYGAASQLSHFFRSVAAYLAVFVHCLPSVVWLMIFWSGWIGRKTRPADSDPVGSNTLLMLIFWISLLSPVLFAVAQMPPAGRYFNLFLFLLALIALLRTFNGVCGTRTKRAAAAVAVLLLVAEVLAFRPVFGAFAPIWAHETDKRFYTAAAPGQLGSIIRWTGWGEEVMLAGRRIEERCRPAGCDGIRLYWAYPGSWLQPTAIARDQIAGISGFPPPAYDQKEYFVINRSAVIQKMVVFPEGVDPVDTISFRGYTQAWIFRGDDLRKAGFRF